MIFFLLQANADASVINCMHNLSRRIAIALQHEERRCQYLTREAKLMLAVQDEVTTMTESETSLVFVLQIQLLKVSHDFHLAVYLSL